METDRFEDLLRLLMYQDLLKPLPPTAGQNRVRYVYLLQNTYASADPHGEEPLDEKGAPEATVISSSFCLN